MRSTFRRLAATLVATFVLGAGGLAVAPAAEAQELREPLLGICVRPLIGEGGLINLPLVDIPGKRIPNESLELTIGGQYRECHVGGIINN